MSVDASILDGKVTNNTSNTAKETKTAKESSTLDKQAFLQLLVAQMKYQDPLEPTDNTEYVAQLAQFSSLEAMNNVSESMDLQRATALVGKTVTVSSTNETTGVTTEVTGTVDYVTHSGSKTFLTIDGNQYNVDDVKQVWDDTYIEADTVATAWRSTYELLPKVDSIDEQNVGQYKDAIQNLVTVFNSMSTYQQSFLTDDEKNGLAAYVAKMKELGVEIQT
ncbi:MAG: flagellar hook capping protein [Lachnospiraceae bacterium]|nr:flagellar hook capping protein [Lachnospiraceae bacterium]